jgi:O-antigen/teichoic acid export membrane protein
MKAVENRAAILAAARDAPGRVHTTGAELKRGAILNAFAMLASNFRAIFTLLIARLLGAAALGIFSVAWATTDLVSKIGIWGLDDATTAFVARAEAMGQRLRSRALFRLSLIVAVTLSAIVSLLSTFAIRRFGSRLRMEPEMISALTVILWALPGIALYRISTSVSRGMKVMKHDIFSRGLTEPFATTIAFLIALGMGFGIFAPEVAQIAGSIAAGIIAFVLAAGLFRDLAGADAADFRSEGRELLLYTLPIGADQFLNAFIWRVDVLILGWFVGRAPGVTLTTLGIYGAVVGLANGLRRVSQPFTPIFAPIVAGMTATGEHGEAAATYARLLQWMLWILLPFVAVMILAGQTILLVFGPTFQQGGQWLGIVAIACATNAFVNLGETVIMVQRPGLNLLNSLITCVVGSIATFLLISRLGVMGAALGILVTYVLQGAIRTIILRFVFHWPNPLSQIRPVVMTATVALIPAVLCRLFWPGSAGQIISALVCLALFGAGWVYYRRSEEQV